MELIDKEKVVVKINELQKKATDLYGCSQFDIAYDNVLEAIDTIEVKDLDFKKEFDEYTESITAQDIKYEPFTQLFACAKYFFELGLKTKKKISMKDKSIIKALKG